MRIRSTNFSFACSAFSCLQVLLLLSAAAARKATQNGGTYNTKGLSTYLSSMAEGRGRELVHGGGDRRHFVVVQKILCNCEGYYQKR
jgi:hypothetical protein